jgi:hypothetical protein
MPSRSPHPDTTPVVRNVRSLANCQNQQKRGPSGNSQLPHAKRRVSVPAGERDFSQGGSFVPSTIQGQNSTPSSSLNNSLLEISLNTWLPPRPLHSDGQYLLQPPRRVQAVVTHQLPAQPYRQTPGALHVEQTAVYECKRLVDGKLCNATRCESIS